MNMLESIRQIGVFMIVAQTVMHFAANGQYEKYMKIIAGIIVLLLFVRPFISGSDGQVIKWQEEITHIMEQIEARSGDFGNMAYEGGSTEALVIRQIEEEITRRLNETAAGHGCRVVKTTIELTGQEKGDSVIGEAGAGEYVFGGVRVTVQKQSGAGEKQTEQAEQSETDVGRMAQTERSGMDEEADRIRIGEITVKVGAETGTEQATDGWGETAENMKELKQLFAQTLGITEDRVEVVYLGGW